MNCPVYAIRDKKAGFLQPMLDSNDETAKRNFAFAVQRGDSMFLAFPDDYDLYRIAEFNTESGEMVGHLPEFICSARTFLVKDVTDNV